MLVPCLPDESSWIAVRARGLSFAPGSDPPRSMAGLLAIILAAEAWRCDPPLPRTWSAGRRVRFARGQSGGSLQAGRTGRHHIEIALQCPVRKWAWRGASARSTRFAVPLRCKPGQRSPVCEPLFTRCRNIRSAKTANDMFPLFPVEALRLPLKRRDSRRLHSKHADTTVNKCRQGLLQLG